MIKLNPMKRLLGILISMGFLCCCAAAGILLDLHLYGDRPLAAPGNNGVFVVGSGQGFVTITRNLRQAGIVRHPRKFKLLARIRGRDRQIKAGEYLLPASLTPNRLLDMLVEGKVRLYRLTIPEGYTLHQIARLVENAHLATASEFLKAARNPHAVRQAGIEAETFEGYLFPDTYYFPKGEPPRAIVSAMVRRFESVFKPQWVARAEHLGFSIHEIVTLASIIEKETGDPAERPVISSVFHNRLKNRMRLESDPTVIYGIEGFDGNLTRKHLSGDAPYNTYRIRGLPPGPIASPGAAALAAALYPKDTRYLYFVSKKDNTHQFSTNIKDHNRAVRKYQLKH